jgi:integrase
MLENDYKANRRQVRTIKAPVAHLIVHFGADRAAIDITSDVVTKYVAMRQGQGAANATINRSLAALKRSFSLAERAGKVARRPYIELLEENNARQGFIINAEFIRLREALPADLRDPVEFLYRSAWRVGEMRSLEWSDVKDGAIRLRSEHSKNKVGRVLPLTRELADIIERARQRRLPELPFVFHRDDGSPIGLFRKSWATACKAARLGTVLVHDLRRSAIKNMVDAKVGEKTAMTISGHKTRSTFERYNIVTQEAVTRALEDVSDHLAAQPKTATTVVPIRKAL